MHKLNQRGSLLIPLVLMIVLLTLAIGFGIWAFSGRQDYKNNADQKINEAVEASNQKISAEKDAEFAEKQKSPYKTYIGPVTFGTLSFNFPRSWSAYVDEKAQNSRDIAGYFYPDFVPSIDSDASFALRFEVVNSAYDDVLKKFDSLIKENQVGVVAYRAPKQPDVLGAQIEGEIIPEKQGVMVLLPLRDKTIKIWTEGDSFRSDFNKLLDTLKFVP